MSKKEPLIQSKSRSCPVRFTSETDAYIQRIMRSRGLNNRNLTTNIIVKEYMLTFEIYQQQIKNKILKMMRDWQIKPGDLDD